MNALLCLPRSRVARVLTLAVLVLAAAGLTGGCGEKKKDRMAGQAAARVNQDEISLNQINVVLQEQRHLRPEQADAASRQVLERLIDQELAVQKAESLKLDRDPRVALLIEAARRQVIARAYAEKVSEEAPKPSPDEVRKYYEDKPALFRERRIYSVQEIAVEARPEQMPALREKLTSVKQIGEFVDYLRSNDYRFAANQAVRAAEQLPLAGLDALSRMKDGQATVTQGPSGLQVLVLAGSRSQPVSEEQARPAIEQYLLNERKRKMIEAEIKALRAAAKIEYFGRFAESPPAAASAASAAPELPGVAAEAASAPR